MRQARLVLGGVFAAIAAAVLTIYALGLTTPPRDIDALLRPSPTLTSIAQLLPTATPVPTDTPAPRNLIYSDNLARAGVWPDSPTAHYTGTGYELNAPADADFLAVPLTGFADTSLKDLRIVSAGTPADSTSVEYGVFFWHSADAQGRERFLAVTISSQRTFRLRAYGPFTTSKGERAMRWTDLTPSTLSRNIRTDGRPNRLEVELHPGHVIVTINGFEVLNRENADIDLYRVRGDFDGHVGLLAVSIPGSEGNAEFSLFELYDATSNN